MNIYIYIITMAVVTYLIRMVPLVAFRKKIENRFVNSFLYYVPYSCLTALTLPSILYSTESVISAVCGFAVALMLGIKQKGLIVGMCDRVRGGVDIEADVEGGSRDTCR